MYFEELGENRLNLNDSLWRYLSIHKFISLTSNRTLLFSRLDLFQDPFEGIATRSIKENYMAGRMPNLEDMDDRIPIDQREHVFALKKALETKFEQESLIKQKTQFINCWFKGQRESMAMWNLYSNKTGIALKLNGRQFIDYLKEQIGNQKELYPNNKFICGQVEYLKLNPVDLEQDKINIRYSALKKDESFQYENEYRLLIKSPESESIAQSNPEVIEIELLTDFFKITEVICHPEMPIWQIENIRNLARGCKFKNVLKSQIILR
jgi:hypothetical protein